MLKPKLPSAERDEPADIDCVSYVLEPHDLQYTSAAESPDYNRSSLTDSGCFKSPSDEFPSAVVADDDFDTLLRQLKCLGNMDLTVFSPAIVQPRLTVPYFPPVTSALREERGWFNYPRSTSVDYADAEPFQSPQFVRMKSSVDREFATSLADVNSISAANINSVWAAELPPLYQTESLLQQMQTCSQSCPDVSSPSAAIVRTSAANVQQWTSPDVARFNGQNVSCFI